MMRRWTIRLILRDEEWALVWASLFKDLIEHSPVATAGDGAKLEVSSRLRKNFEDKVLLSQAM